MKKLLLIVIVFFLSYTTFAQLTLSNGYHVLEISGGVSAYYNKRSLKSEETDRSKDRFKLRDAQVELDGRVGNDFEYEVQVDFADLAAYSSTQIIDPENPGLMQATVKYKGLHFLDIEMGYGKLYYSRNAMVPFDMSIYWQRPELARGSIFSTRDVGITIMKNFWKQRANLYLGAYTGLGELSIAGDNDASGQLEYVGRFDISYPARYRYHEADDRVSPIPMFSLGVNGRYMNKQQPEGEVLPINASGEYGLKVIDGERFVYGLDASVQYMGFSAQFEIHQIKAVPQSLSDPLLQNFTESQTHGYVLAGGYFAQLNYFIKRWHTILSTRYEELDLNDLVVGSSQRISPAIAYQIHGYNAMIKFQYFNILKEESIDPLKWDEQFRIGMQFQFK